MELAGIPSNIEDDRESDGNFKYSEEYRSFVRVCFRFFFRFFAHSAHISLFAHKNVDGESKFSYVSFSGRLKIFPLLMPLHTLILRTMFYVRESFPFRFGKEKENCWICENWFFLFSLFSLPFISSFLTFFKQQRAHAVEQLTRMFGASSHHTQRVQRIHPVENHPSTAAHDHTRCLSNNCTQESNNKSHGLWPLQALGWRR